MALRSKLVSNLLYLSQHTLSDNREFHDLGECYNLDKTGSKFFDVVVRDEYTFPNIFECARKCLREEYCKSFAYRSFLLCFFFFFLKIRFLQLKYFKKTTNESPNFFWCYTLCTRIMFYKQQFLRLVKLLKNFSNTTGLFWNLIKDSSFIAGKKNPATQNLFYSFLHWNKTLKIFQRWG